MKLTRGRRGCAAEISRSLAAVRGSESGSVIRRSAILPVPAPERPNSAQQPTQQPTQQRVLSRTPTVSRAEPTERPARRSARGHSACRQSAPVRPGVRARGDPDWESRGVGRRVHPRPTAPTRLTEPARTGSVDVATRPQSHCLSPTTHPLGGGESNRSAASDEPFGMLPQDVGVARAQVTECCGYITQKSCPEAKFRAYRDFRRGAHLRSLLLYRILCAKAVPDRLERYLSWPGAS